MYVSGVLIHQAVIEVLTVLLLGVVVIQVVKTSLNYCGRITTSCSHKNSHNNSAISRSSGSNFHSNERNRGSCLVMVY